MTRFEIGAAFRRRWIGIVAVLVIVCAADQIARASGGFDWTDWFANSDTVQLGVKVWKDGGDPGPGDDTDIITTTATRGPIVGGTCSLDAVVTSSNSDLVSIRLLEGNDTNGNGTIDAGEWAVLGTAGATSDGSGGTTATISGVMATAGSGAHRIEQTFSWGVTFDDVRDSNLN